MFEVVRWAADQYHRCLVDSPLAEVARRYLNERQLSGETIRRFGLGYAPAEGEWLSKRAAALGVSEEILEKVGLLGVRQEGTGHYDRFRDRVMFPIRNRSGEAAGFGGRILPSSPFAARVPKYYNSCETPFFTKSEHLYGIDQARQAALATGYVAVVEGYTDVLMAHQMGIGHVVATMGTALNSRHVRHLRQLVPRVVLVFDADAGGETGVDRALEIFVSQDVELAIASLPEGLDPCELLLRDGPDAFRNCLSQAVDALEFKVRRLLVASTGSIEERRRAVDAILGVVALAPPLLGHEGAVKKELIITRIGEYLGLQEATVRGRLKDLEENARSRAARNAAAAPGTSPAAVGRFIWEERELLEMLLAEPALVQMAAAEVKCEQVQDPDLRRLLEELYRLYEERASLSFDSLRERLGDPRLESLAFELEGRGRLNEERGSRLRQLLGKFRERHHVAPLRQEIKNQLVAAPDSETTLDLLRRLQRAN
jgi:DNA primase